MHKEITIHTLDASLSSSLEWEIPENAPEYWALDFGWEKKPLSIFDEAHFRNYELAVQEFSKLIQEPAKVIFAKANSPFSELIAPSERREIGYAEYLEDNGASEEPLFYELYCTDLFSEYLHKLAAGLPDETMPYLWNLPPINSTPENALLLCKRRFAHFALEVAFEGNIGVSLPKDPLFNPESYLSLFTYLKGNGLSFQCIPEEQLNDFWDGLDHLIVDPETMSETGLRMLFGFEAAGGGVVSMRGAVKGCNATLLQEWQNPRV